MIQISENITMFAASQTKRCSYIDFAIGYFYVLIRSFVSKDIRLSNPCFLLHSICSSLLVEMGGDSLSCFSIFQISKKLMTKRNEICNAGNNSTRLATSTHETRSSRTLRTGRPFQTMAERLSLILLFLNKYPEIRKMKIRQTGKMFIARARAGKRSLHAGAFSLHRLHAAFENECRIKLENPIA